MQANTSTGIMCMHICDGFKTKAQVYYSKSNKQKKNKRKKNDRKK